jgi:putative transcriptional regulator
MSKLFEEMAQGTAEARAYMEGERKGYKVTLPESIDVRGIRKSLRFSQGRFANAFGLSVDAVRHWESGRRSPEAAARALLLVIAHDPQLVMRALSQSQPSGPASIKAQKTLPRSGRARRSSATSAG